MDPLVVFDCQKVVPNRFALILAAAARSRALNRGAEPRVNPHGAGVSEMALHEIASGAFTRDELAPFLPRTDQRLSLPLPAQGARLCGGGSPSPAAAPASQLGETVY